MPESKNIFAGGGMEKDLDERLVKNGYYRDAVNVEVETAEGSNAGAVKNKKGNTKTVDISSISGQPDTGCKTIGSVRVEAENLLYWAVSGDFFDGIYEYNNTTGISSRVLQSNKFDSGGSPKESVLGFSKSNLITGMNVIIGSRGERFLAWVDDLNEPRLINIERCKTYAIDDAKIEQDIDVALVPPLYAPHIKLKKDFTEPSANNMTERFLYFATRFKYMDDRYSSFSPFSPVAFFPKSYEIDYGEGNNRSMINDFNSVDVTFETGDEFVKEVQVLVRDANGINVKIIDNFIKNETPGFVDNTTYTINFKNSKLYATISDSQVNRLYDNVPLRAKAQEVVGNKLAYGNYTQFRDIVNSDNEKINVEYHLNDYQNEVGNGNPGRTWRSDRDREVALIYLDDKGRMTTALTSKTNTNYIPPVGSAFSNSITVNIESEAPSWATHFRLAVKQKKGDYYNIFPLVYYAQGNDRYFLITSSDVDKVNEGGYIIFKSDTEGATFSNKKYKILDVKQKSANFLSSGGTQIAGVYIHIKVDDISEFSPGALQTISHTGRGQMLPVSSELELFFEDRLTGLTRFPDNPVYYGDNNPDALSVVPDYSDYFLDSSKRVTIEITSSSTFRYTTDPTVTSGWVEGVSISSSPIQISIGSFLGADGYIYITFDPSYIGIVGDKWKINCRNLRNVWGRMDGLAEDAASSKKTWACANGSSFGNSDTVIYPGAVIRFRVIEDRYNPAEQPIQEFVSPARYDNIEEWWWESGAYNEFKYYVGDTSNNLGYKAVHFLRGNASSTGFGFSDRVTSASGDLSITSVDEARSRAVRMLILGQGVSSDLGGINPFDGIGDESYLSVSLEIQQLTTGLNAETEASDIDNEIFHELSQTYTIENGNHIPLWKYDRIYNTSEWNGVSFEDALELQDSTASRPHYFNVGETIELVDTSDGYVFTGVVYSVPDRYRIIILNSVPHPGSFLETGYVKHESLPDKNQSGPWTPATITLNHNINENSDFDAFCWGNGIESYRIKDDFNSHRHQQSLRATTAIEDYKQVTNRSAICYSQSYREETSVNRLNEFNLSLRNFKYLENSFGSIQRLHSRDTDLVVLQEDKISVVLYGKNVLFDSVGGGDVVSIPEVLGTQIPLPYEFGIGKNPESFDFFAEDIFFTDVPRGKVLHMTGRTIDVISNYGMSDFFRDLMVDNMHTQKIGAYDPFTDMYVLHSNETSSTPCSLELLPSLKTITKNAFTNLLMFSVVSDASWTVSLVDNGFGTSWVTLPAYYTSGSLNQNIHADVAENTTELERSVIFRVTYCGGLTSDFLLRQRKGTGGVVIGIVSGPKRR